MLIIFSVLQSAHFFGRDELLKHKKVYQSSTAYGGFAHYAVDGNFDQNYSSKSCTHTRTSDNPSWTIEFPNRSVIHFVVIVNRGDCCGERLSGFKIDVGYLGGGYKTYSGPKKTSTKEVILVNSCAYAIGNYLKIWLPGERKILSLCEVRVYGTILSAGDFEILKHKKVYQSSTAYGGAAHLAVDRNFNQNYHSKSCTFTKKSNNPSWTIEFPKRSMIYFVVIHNRGDCCGERLSGFKIDVGSVFEYRTCSGPEKTLTKEVIGVYDCVYAIGNYLSIWLPGNNRILSLCEVQIYGTTKIKTDQSSQGSGVYLAHDALLPIDGDLTTCTATGIENQPWWHIELSLKPTAIIVQFFYHRPGLIYKGNYYVNVVVADNIYAVFYPCGQKNDTYGVPYKYVRKFCNFRNMPIGVVRLQLSGKAPLYLCDVQIYRVL